jgi:hypothetical protein
VDKTTTEVRCAQCKTVFEKKREWQKFCSPVCRTKHFIKVGTEEVKFARKIKAQMETASPQVSNLDAA